MEDLTGRKFGNLKVIGLSDVQKKGNRYWDCKCICGKITQSVTGKLKYGHKTSCGCMRKVRIKVLQRFGTTHHGWRGCGELSGSIWNRIKQCAKKRGKEFTITITEAWDLYKKQDGICSISKVKLHLAKTSAELLAGENTASLDRIDSTKGYVPGNVQWVHVAVNYMKQDFDQSEFIAWCHKIAKENHVYN